MIRKSNYKKNELIAAIGQRVQAFQDATHEVDEAASRQLHLNRTDMRCLSVLSQAGTTSASQLADATGLTRGAMTTALDRLEASGYVRRASDQQDRRAVRVEVTDAAKKEIEGLYGPLAKEGFELLQTYSASDLAAVLRYLEDGWRLQRAHAQRMRQLGDAPRGRRGLRSKKGSARR
jgi:DNA-binding MarR family transcriptional regulator